MNSEMQDQKFPKDYIYCFIATKSSEVISKIKASKRNWVEFASSELNLFLLVNRSFSKEEGVISLSVINDIGDYDIPQIFAKLMDGDFISYNENDSLISLSCMNKHYFACMTDFWGIMTHYWYKSEDTFICSNNIFLISSIIEGKLCKEAIYEYLFFLAPRKDHTWFENVKCLLPGQQLIFNINTNSVKCSEGTNFSNLFKSSVPNIFDAVEEFFLKAKDTIDNPSKNYIALSYGSDSRTVLACLRHFDLEPHAISFGRNDMVETHQITKFVNNFKIPWQLVNLEGFENDFNKLFSKGTYISNGLLNPFRTHYMILYDQIKPGNTLFEGILGSEFIKGEICIDAMTSALHNDVIVNAISITEAIEQHYPELSNDEKGLMSKYIGTTYGKELVDINSNEGLKCYQQFAFGFIPSRIFGGVILLELANGISPYIPFLSPKILGSIFKNRNGISSSVTLRKDFPGYIKSLSPEAEIVKYADTQIYNSVLDRNIRFCDVFSPLYLARLRWIYYVIIDILKTKKNLKPGQIENTKIQKITHDIANMTDFKYLSFNQNKNTFNPLSVKAIVNLSSVLETTKSIIP